MITIPTEITLNQKTSVRGKNGNTPLDINLKTILFVATKAFIANNLAKFVFNGYATIEVPINVADQYNHKSPTEPDINAGAKDLAEFIEASEKSYKH